MEHFEGKMKAAGLSEAAIGAFRLNYEQLVAGVTGLVIESSVCNPHNVRRMRFLLMASFVHQPICPS